MGGSSRSTQQQTTISTTENLAITDSERIQLLDAEGNIEILDAGAIDRAFEFGESSLTAQSDAFAELLDFGAGIQRSNQSALDTVTAAVTGEQRTDAQTASLVRIGIIGAVLIAGIFLFVNR